MDCLKDPACHKDVDEADDPRSLEMEDDMAGEPDKEPNLTLPVRSLFMFGYDY